MLVEIHYLHEYCKIMASFGEGEDDYSKEIARINELAEELRENGYFASLPERRQRHCLAGREAFFASNEVLTVHFGLDSHTYLAIYKWLSN